MLYSVFSYFRCPTSPLCSPTLFSQFFSFVPSCSRVHWREFCTTWLQSLIDWKTPGFGWTQRRKFSSPLVAVRGRLSPCQASIRSKTTAAGWFLFWNVGATCLQPCPPCIIPRCLHFKGLTCLRLQANCISIGLNFFHNCVSLPSMAPLLFIFATL